MILVTIPGRSFFRRVFLIFIFFHVLFLTHIYVPLLSFLFFSLSCFLFFSSCCYICWTFTESGIVSLSCAIISDLALFYRKTKTGKGGKTAAFTFIKISWGFSHYGQQGKRKTYNGFFSFFFLSVTTFFLLPSYAVLDRNKAFPILTQTPFHVHFPPPHALSVYRCFYHSHVLSLTTVSSAATYCPTSLAPLSVRSLLLPSTTTTGTTSTSAPAALISRLHRSAPIPLSRTAAAASPASMPASAHASASTSSAAGILPSQRCFRNSASASRRAASSPLAAWKCWISRCAWNVPPAAPSVRRSGGKPRSDARDCSCSSLARRASDPAGLRS